MNSYYKRPRRALELLKSGRLTLLENGIHDLICQQAEWRTNGRVPPGIWFGSATALERLGPRRFSARALRHALQRLEENGFIRCFRTRGHKGDYPILVHDHSVRTPAGQELWTDAFATTDWRAPVLRPVRDRANGQTWNVGSSLAPPRTAAEATPPAADDCSEKITSGCERLYQLYLEYHGALAPAPSFRGSRLRRAQSCLKQCADVEQFLERFQAALIRAQHSPFLLGNNRRRRPFDIDWFLRDAGNIEKVLAGTYEDHNVPANDSSEPKDSIPRRADSAESSTAQADLQKSEAAHASGPDRPGSLAIGEPADDPERKQAAAVWTPVLEDLRRRVNPKAFNTWLAPLRPLKIDEGTLVLRAPTSDFQYVKEKFAGVLPVTCPPLKLLPRIMLNN